MDARTAAIASRAGEPIDELGQGVVAGGVVGQPITAKPPADRAEPNEESQGIAGREGHEIERAVELGADERRNNLTPLTFETARIEIPDHTRRGLE